MCENFCVGRGNIIFLFLGAGAVTDVQICSKKLAGGGQNRY